ncbi:YbjN domain-containing protein [Phenylobacterium sp.]|uniref:YbjN domain-containing protein n=1 Tax=Phenylobacterium sp. TaxID=1871053 RepID=UPI00286C06EE|nr:YbjN domain-containing protein [Phenylobacterium sp.]
MLRKTLSVLAAAVLSLGAAPPHRPAVAKAAPTRAAPADLDFDARNPASLIALLTAAGAKATVAAREADTVFVAVTSTAADFSMQFADCSAQGRDCKAVLFDNITDKAGPSFAQLNAFNQSSLTCRGYEDKTGKPHVVYSTLLFADDSRQRIATQVAAWRGCVGEFRNFLKDPTAYLASAP